MELDLIGQSHHDFSDHGILSEAKGFEYRPEQQHMALAVAGALVEERPILIEAGTGVGKSLAYLIPSLRFALEYQRKAIISTHTINLQEQLFHKDIPTVKKALGIDFNAALLKGRGNYLCFTRLKRALDQARDLFNQDETRQLHDLWAWSRDCGEGSLSELPSELDISFKIWAQVRSENHICTPRFCGMSCPYQAARLRVQEAQVVILNHTLLFGLIALNDLTRDEEEEQPDEGFLYPRDFLILDEAHTIEAVAAKQLGFSISDSELRFDLLRLFNPRTKKGALRHHASPIMLQLVEEAQLACDEFFNNARLDSNLEAHQGCVRLRRPEWTEDILSPALEQLALEVKQHAEVEENDLTRAELNDIVARLNGYREICSAMVKMPSSEHVYWIESTGEEGRYTRLIAALINVADELRERLFSVERALILTSATFSTGLRKMTYFMGRIGAEGTEGLQIGSPFNFKEQMRIVVSRCMPSPPPASQEDHYQDALAAWIYHYLCESDGRAFVLFTSYGLMRVMAQRLRALCQEQGWPLLVQGEQLDRRRMLDEFKKHVGSVLFGTESFWTGVDVPGEALSNVIITKIPFESPSNPLTEARCEAITERGGKPFFDYTLPEALLKFRQGVGRLIRAKSDKGMIVLLDSRITGKSYGAAFMHAMPADARREFLDVLPATRRGQP